MKKAPSIFSKFKSLWDNARTLFQDDKKISFCIQSFAVNSVFSEYKKNSSVLSEVEKKEFENMIRELAVEKKSIGQDANCTLEEYEAFLENVFANVDDEDRHGEVTMKTSASFKLLGEIIDVLGTWGPISDAWAKKSKSYLFIINF
jgi:hypothetical protein